MDILIPNGKFVLSDPYKKFVLVTARTRIFNSSTSRFFRFEVIHCGIRSFIAESGSLISVPRYWFTDFHIDTDNRKKRF
jgi:hypothetical protein